MAFSPNSPLYNGLGEDADAKLFDVYFFDEEWEVMEGRSEKNVSLYRVAVLMRQWKKYLEHKPNPLGDVTVDIRKISMLQVEAHRGEK